MKTASTNLHPASRRYPNIKEWAFWIGYLIVFLILTREGALQIDLLIEHLSNTVSQYSLFGLYLLIYGCFIAYGLERLILLGLRCTEYPAPSMMSLPSRQTFSLLGALIIVIGLIFAIILAVGHLSFSHIHSHMKKIGELNLSITALYITIITLIILKILGFIWMMLTAYSIITHKRPFYKALLSGWSMMGTQWWKWLCLSFAVNIFFNTGLIFPLILAVFAPLIILLPSRWILDRAHSLPTSSTTPRS